MNPVVSGMMTVVTGSASVSFATGGGEERYSLELQQVPGLPSLPWDQHHPGTQAEDTLQNDL